MSRHFVQYVARPSAFVICLFGTTRAAAISSGERDQVVTAIRAVLRTQEAAWNRGDIDGFMSGYARARSTIFVSEDKVMRGWVTVRERYYKKYSDPRENGRSHFFRSRDYAACSGCRRGSRPVAIKTRPRPTARPLYLDLSTNE